MLDSKVQKQHLAPDVGDYTNTEHYTDTSPLLVAVDYTNTENGRSPSRTRSRSSSITKLEGRAGSPPSDDFIRRDSYGSIKTIHMEEPEPVQDKPLQFVEELWMSVSIGLAGGVFTAVYGIVLKIILDGVWATLPDYLYRMGWTQKSTIPLQFYVLLVAVVLTTAGATLGLALPSYENINKWIDEIHTKGRGDISWAIPILLVSLCTVPAGVSGGLEGIMIASGSTIAGYLGHTLKRGTEVTRWFSLVGAAACVSAFFAQPLAGSFFVLTKIHKTGEPQYFEALFGSLLASIVCCSLSKALLVASKNPLRPLGYIVEDTWLFDTPTDVPPLEAILVGICAGALGCGVAAITAGTDKIITWSANKYPHLQGWFTMIVGSIIVGLIGMLRPSLLFWGEFQLPYAMGNVGPLPVLSPHLQNGFFERLQETKVPIQSWDFFLQGIAKAFLAGMSKACKFPGGLVFPMLYSGAAVGTGLMRWLIQDRHPVDVVLLAPACVMAATQSVLDKTPYATVLLVLDLHAGGYKMSTVVAVLAAVIVAEVISKPFAFMNMFPAQRHRQSFVTRSCVKNE